MTSFDTSTRQATSATDARTPTPSKPKRRRLRIALAPVLLFASLGGLSSAAVRHAAPVVAPPSVMPPMMDDPAADRPLHLAPATTPPIAAPAELTRARMAAREVFAFAPYWMLDVQKTFDLRHVTTLAYFGVDIARDGSIMQKGNGWVGYQSQDLADLISRAHRAGIRVVLTIKAFSNETIHAVATDPAAGAALARNVIAAAKAKSFDGVNIDFEGTGSADRTVFAVLARSLSAALHVAEPTWQVTLDSYVSSAEDSNGFFDIAAIAPAVDSFFIMGYDMYHREVASPNAPLPSYESAIAVYSRVVPASKIILGAPFYGYDWATRDNSLHAQAIGAPTPVSYAEIAAAGRPRYWDSSASVPWTAYQVGGQWHEIYYDDSSSLALKARLANSAHLRGTGAWALGMNGNDGGLVAALLGTLTTIVSGPSSPVVAVAPKQQGTTSSRPASAPRPASSTAPKPTASPTMTPTSSPTPTSTPILVLPLL
jgi:glycosyl hydrolase family 18 (putative chitinase)